MELFHETKSKAFKDLVYLLNKISIGESFDQKVKDNIDDDLWEGVSNAHTPNICKPIYASAVPIQPCILELQWLKEILDREQMKPFLSTDVKEKLREKLKDIAPLTPPDIWQKSTINENIASSDDFREKLSTAITALIQQKQIFYKNRDHKGTIHQGIVSPYQLEYDLQENQYSLIIWNEECNRAIKIKFENLLKLQITSHDNIDNLSEKAAAFFQNQRNLATPLILKVSDKNNAVERCFALFACYDKESYIDNADYILKIFFPNFDQAMILRFILSLGSAVTVIEPASIREKIIDIYKQSQQNYV